MKVSLLAALSSVIKYNLKLSTNHNNFDESIKCN